MWTLSHKEIQLLSVIIIYVLEVGPTHDALDRFEIGANILQLMNILPPLHIRN